MQSTAGGSIGGRTDAMSHTSPRCSSPSSVRLMICAVRCSSSANCPKCLHTHTPQTLQTDRKQTKASDTVDVTHTQKHTHTHTRRLGCQQTARGGPDSLPLTQRQTTAETAVPKKRLWAQTLAAAVSPLGTTSLDVTLSGSGHTLSAHIFVFLLYSLFCGTFFLGACERRQIEH